ncbi:MAG TPA: hypothetical protein VKQ71_08210 [Acidimicrobiales bacterium]|nr:hypothetical protein [Acidimicrobiales bacterium]
MPGIDTVTPLLVGVSGGYQAQVTNTGNQGIYYQNRQVGGTISATINDGTIAVGAALTVPYGVYLLGAGPGAAADISVTTPAQQGLSLDQKMLRQMVIANEIMAETMQPRRASLDAPQNTAAL